MTADAGPEAGPEARSPAGATATPHTPLPPLVVVVDDDDAVRGLVLKLLEGRGYRVEGYGTLAAAAERLDAASLDLLVVDVDLPDGCGLDLIPRARDAQGAQVAAIVLSGRSAEGDFVRGFAAGAVDYVDKPFSRGELLARCAVHLARRCQVPAGTEEDGGPAGLPTRDGLVFGRYRVERTLGHGGHGEVFLARDERREGAPVALKVLAEVPGEVGEVRARFVREAYTLATVEDRRVARLHDVGAVRGRLYFAMEYVEGPTLDAYVRGTGPLAEADACELTRGLLQAVAALERVSLVHRDIKPANVMLRGASPHDPVLVDFGLAKRSFDRGLTGEGVVLGTLGFISPEAAVGREADHRSDLFGVGLCLRYALTGEPAFPELEGVALLNAMASTPVPLPARPLRRGLTRLLTALLALSPARRPPTAAVALALLDAA